MLFRSIRIIARDIQELGVADRIIPEPLGGAHKDREVAAEMLDEVLSETLDELVEIKLEDLLSQRYDKFRSIGKIE